MVEFAVSATAFVLLFLGIVDFGIALYAYDQVGQAARLGARWAIVNTPVPPSTCTTAGSVCQTNIANYLVNKSGLDPTRLTTTITFAGTSSVPNASACSVAPSVGCYVNVQLRYAYSFLVLPLPSITMTTSSQMTIAHQYKPT